MKDCTHDTTGTYCAACDRELPIFNCEGGAYNVPEVITKFLCKCLDLPEDKSFEYCLWEVSRLKRLEKDLIRLDGLRKVSKK